MAQISGSNTSVALTNPWLRATQEPSSFRHRIPSLTYYRTITTDALPYPRRRPDRQQIDAGRKPQIATVPYNGTQMPWWAVPSSPWYYSYGGPTWQYWLPFMVGMDVGSWMGAAGMAADSVVGTDMMTVVQAGTTARRRLIPERWIPPATRGQARLADGIVAAPVARTPMAAGMLEAAEVGIQEAMEAAGTQVAAEVIPAVVGRG